jgi:AbrB family looped-hinge helix DNA binding protein
MDRVTLSTKFQLVLPRGARQRLGLRPGTKFTVLDKGGVIYLIPERPMKGYRGIAAGTTPRALREKKDRL